MRIGRWLLVCAALAVAGGLPSIRTGYAEVAAAAHAVSLRRARRLVVVTPSSRPPRVTRASVLPQPRIVAVARIYVTHSALLL
jgi:hypothetical protein